jgi:cytochrome b
MWLFILPVVQTNNLELKDLKCTTSEKKSAEFGICEHNGRFVTVHVTFLRALHNFKVVHLKKKQIF